MKILVDIPKDKYDLICMCAENMGGFIAQYIADGEIIEDEDIAVNINDEEKVCNAVAE